LKVFVDTWAWIALALRRDQNHLAAKVQHAKFVATGSTYLTTDLIIAELITQLYRVLPAAQAQQFVDSLFMAIGSDAYIMEWISPARFTEAWRLRQKFVDKPSISFVDFTSFVVARELGIRQIFTGDDHFRQANLGFELLP
jgi:predicted nucleic acid-binding protein